MLVRLGTRLAGSAARATGPRSGTAAHQPTGGGNAGARDGRRTPFLIGNGKLSQNKLFKSRAANRRHGGTRQSRKSSVYSAGKALFCFLREVEGFVEVVGVRRI